MKTSEVLRKAADEIRRRGWCQGEFMPPDANPDDCPVCAWGAVNVAENDDPREWYVKDGPGEESAALEYLQKAYRDEFRSVPAWNDDPERTVEEVLDAFTRAAEAAEQTERAAQAAELEESSGE